MLQVSKFMFITWECENLLLVPCTAISSAHAHLQALLIHYKFSTWCSSIINDYTYYNYFHHSFIFIRELLNSKSVCLFLLCFYIVRLSHGNPSVNCMRHLLYITVHGNWWWWTDDVFHNCNSLSRSSACHSMSVQDFTGLYWIKGEVIMLE